MCFKGKYTRISYHYGMQIVQEMISEAWSKELYSYVIYNKEATEGLKLTNMISL